MGNILSEKKQLTDKICTLEEQVKMLNEKIENLTQEKVTYNTEKMTSIDEFVEKWYRENKEVNIGLINIPMVGEIDVLPNKVEKHIYKKSLLIASSLMEDMLENLSFNILDKKIEVKINKREN
tara:strand:+ start:399 stop:767 length:369 start_codon:yes stop_codon:yes gene_type:complete